MKINPTILAIETATISCSAAILCEDRLFTKAQIAPKEHTTLIFPMIQHLLKQANLTLADLDAIAVGQGPGSFTGVRIAISLAQGLAFALQKPVYPISTLAALAHQARDQEWVIPALDARMQEIYTALYHNGTQIKPEVVCTPDKMVSELVSNHKMVVLGSGWDVYYQTLQKQHPQLNIELVADCHPHAQEIALLAQRQWQQGLKGKNAQELLPVYLRDDVAKKAV